jgi:hypothetical protein
LLPTGWHRHHPPIFSPAPSPGRRRCRPDLAAVGPDRCDSALDANSARTIRGWRRAVNAPASVFADGSRRHRIIALWR